ncbi:MAG: HYR domain-containing protein [candidate division Zixibacteria bacterium]|nr:HYR domain-containing protein [candidate division Zixibacteria bacterium]
MKTIRLVCLPIAAVLACIALMAASASAQGFCFNAVVNYATGLGPQSVYAADLDGDGDRDLAVATGGLVAVLKNNGNGTFAAAVNYVTGGAAVSVVAVDLDADGDRDLAVANNSPSNVAILKNNGNGTFTVPTNYAAGASAASICTADLDADGDFDLAVANQGGANVSVLKNNGNATFAAPVNYGAGANPTAVYTADLDGDTDFDLAVANNSATVSVLMNNGNGTFAAAMNYAAGGATYSVVAIDLDGDGDRDLAVANMATNNVSILKNNGVGIFAAAINYAVGTQPTSVAAADFDWDSDQDLVFTCSSINRVAVLANNGTGAFGPATLYVPGVSPWAVTTAFLDGDLSYDLAVGNSGSGNVSVFTNCFNRPPVAICQNITRNADASCLATVTPIEVDNGSYDPDPGQTLTYQLSPPGPFGLGANAVSLTVRDPQGRPADCGATITVVDATPPVVNCPASLTVGTDPGQCGAVVTLSVDATDNCSTPTLEYLPPSGTFFPVGTTNVRAIASDAAANADTCYFDVIVNDIEPPVVVCPPTVTRNNDAGQCGAIVTFSVTATDNCPGQTVLVNPPSGSFFPVGTTSVRAISTDVSGNADTCQFNVTVNDMERPVLNCPGDINTTVQRGATDTVVTFVCSATDNCPGVSVTCLPPSGSPFPVGQTLVLCTAIDGAGYLVQCVFRVTVTERCSCPWQGDISANGLIDVFDVIGVIGIAFAGDPDPQDPDCPRTRGDANNDGVSDVFDVIYLIATAFSGGAKPLDPCTP